MSNEEIAEAYRRAIEVLWKFLKTHLKLDKMMSKNLNGITMQIDAILIVYLLLQWHGYAYRNSTHTVFSFIMGYSSNIWQTNLQKKKD